MKLKHLFLILLALCTVFFLTGCDSGGGSSSDSDGDGDGGDSDSGTLTYVTSALLDDTGASGFSVTNGVMTYTLSGDNWEQYSTLKVDIENKTFELYEREKLNGATIVDLTFYGTWTGDGTTSITAHCSSSKETGSSTENPQDWDIVMAIDGNNIYWTSGEYFNWIWTKQ
ncbi:MAG: hypothetical protein IJM77_02170 [Spirochaetia bacterium]|nr:hypothetical protein [Spirochaetia bacterium]